MTPEAIQWLNRFAQLPINDHQRLALVYLKQNHDIDNQDYRRLNRVDMMAAGNDLRGSGANGSCGTEWCRSMDQISSKSFG